jgi:hypothetical protein
MHSWPIPPSWPIFLSPKIWQWHHSCLPGLWELGVPLRKPIRKRIPEPYWIRFFPNQDILVHLEKADLKFSPTQFHKKPSERSKKDNVSFLVVLKKECQAFHLTKKTN